MEWSRGGPRRRPSSRWAMLLGLRQRCNPDRPDGRVERVTAEPRSADGDIAAHKPRASSSARRRARKSTEDRSGRPEAARKSVETRRTTATPAGRLRSPEQAGPRQIAGLAVGVRRTVRNRRSGTAALAVTAVAAGVRTAHRRRWDGDGTAIRCRAPARGRTRSRRGRRAGRGAIGAGRGAAATGFGAAASAQRLGPASARRGLAALGAGARRWSFACVAGALRFGAAFFARCRLGLRSWPWSCALRTSAFLAAPLRAAARFFFFAGAFFAFFLVFFVFDFAFFAMIDLPIVRPRSIRIITLVGKAGSACPAPYRHITAATASPGTAGNRLPFSPPGSGPPVAQSISSTVWTTGIDVPAAICVIQPMLPAAITSGLTFSIFATLRLRSRSASSGWRMLYVPAEPQHRCDSGTSLTTKPRLESNSFGGRTTFCPCCNEQAA